MLDQLKNVYTKDYGLGDDYRIHAVIDSLLYGVEAAAKKRRVSVTSIYRWRKDYAEATRKELLG
jgi:hypothetical protein